MSAEQRAAFIDSHLIYQAELSRKFTGDLGPLEPHERPLEFRMVEARKSPASLLLLTGRLLAVDAPLKEIIETLEPGVHQFWPLRITQSTGQYYGMVIRRFLDSFVPEQSDVLDSGGPSSFFAKSPTKKDYANVTLSKSAVAGAHLWRERRLFRPGVYLSDDLQAEIARRGLRMPRHHRLKVI